MKSKNYFFPFVKNYISFPTIFFLSCTLGEKETKLEQKIHFCFPQTLKLLYNYLLRPHQKKIFEIGFFFILLFVNNIV